MGKQYIFTIADLTKKHGTKAVLENIWLAFYPGAKIGVLGRNGAGKSSLLRIMAGDDTDFDGEARLTEGFTRGYLSQEPRLTAQKDVWENLQEAIAPRQAIVDRFNEISVLLSDPMDDVAMQKLCDEMARLQDKIDAENLWELEREIEIAMDVMNLPPRDADVDMLSGGERRRVALCKLLLQRPDLLLLDEPTNHLDAEAVNWLERHLAEYPGTVVAVTHDRYFLDNVANWILELDRGQGIPWEGNYSSWLEQKQQRLGREEKSASARRKTLQRELEWIRMAPRARQAKSKARIKAYEQMASASFEQQLDEFEIQIPPGKHLGELVVDANDACKQFDDVVLFDQLSFRLPAGGIVGVIGPNGAGKTTLFRLMVGEEELSSGRTARGTDGRVWLCGSEPRCPAARSHRFRRDLGRTRDAGDGWSQSERPGLRVAFQLSRPGPGKESGRLVGWGTQPRALGKAAAAGLKCPAAGRTHQRPGRRHVASPGRGHPELRGLCRRNQPRSLVSRPYCNAYSGF